MDKLQEKGRFFCINIRDCLVPGEEAIIGENELKEILFDFSSPRNKDVELFLKECSVKFTKKHQSVTYLIFTVATIELVGYFSITVKPITIEARGLSNTAKKKLDRIGKYNKESENYTVAAYLIAQFGKNYSEKINSSITGIELMHFAVGRLRKIQYELGGIVVYLECEDIEALMHFYRDKNGFKLFGERMTDSQNGTQKLLQLLNFL